jgi:hypothetical protein
MEDSANKYFNKYLKQVYKLIGHKTTTNSDELNIVGNTLFGKKYKGTYSSDNYPNLKKNECMIVNVDKSNKSGSHWVGIYCYDKKKFLIFDSFGRKSSLLFPHFGKGYKLLDTDYDKDQKESDKDCGQRSISFLMVCYERGIKYAKLI